MKHKKKSIAAAVILLGLGYYLWTRLSEKNAPAPPEITRAVTMDVEEDISATGRIEAKTTVDIKSEVAGVIMELLADQGDRVKKGQKIVSLDATQARMRYKEAEATYTLKKNALTRSLALFEKGFITASQMEQAQSEYDISEAKYLDAKKSFDQTTIYSPISGIVVKRNVDVGDTINSVSSISSGDIMYTIADLSQKYVRANLDEVDIGKIKIGSDAEVNVDAFPEKIFKGKVVEIAPMAEIKQELAFFDILVEAYDPENLLKINMSADVRLITKKAPDAVCIPYEALKGRIGKYYVLLQKNGEFKKQDVAIGIESDDIVQITAGLKEGDAVLLGELDAGKKKAQKSSILPMPRGGRRR